MWIKLLFVLYLGTILGNSFDLENFEESPRSLESLLEELQERERRGDALHEECEGKPADIAFIIDSSRSIYGPDYDKGIEFLRYFINIFQIDPDNVRIAAVSFGQRVITDTAFGFDKYDNKADALAGIKSIRFRPELGGSTNTAMAIAYARKNFFANARPNVKKIAIVLTDGRSDNFIKTEAEADLLKSQGVEITAIGVGSAVMERELQAIASNDENVFKVNSYGALKNIIRTLGFITCKVTTTAAPSTTPTTTTTTTTTTTPAPTPPPKAEPCDGQAIDFNFVFDSAQMGLDGTEGAIRFIRTVVSAEDLNNGKVRVGTITGPCPDTKGFHLNRYKNLPEIMSHFDEFTTTDMAELISELRTEAFDPANGGREGARKVGVVFLKGKLSKPDRAILETQLAKTKGIEVFVVNMGSLNHESVLESMASDKSHILPAVDSRELVEMARTLVAQICQKKVKPDC